MNYNIRTPGENPYAGLFGLIGTIMGQNAAQRNEAGIARTLQGLGEQPQPTATQQGGLLPQVNTNFNPALGDQSLAPTAQNIGVSQMQAMNPQPQNVQQRMAGLLSPNGTQFDTGIQPQPIPKTQQVDQQSITPTTDQQQIEQPTVKQSTDSTTPPTTPAKPSTQSLQAPVKNDITKSYKKQQADAIIELTGKRGMSYKDALAVTNDAVNKRVEEDYNTKANEYADQLHSQLDDVTNLDLSKNVNKSKALATIAKINYGLQKIGRPGVDMSLMKELMSVNDLKIDKVDTGDGVQYIGYNSDGSIQVPIGQKIMKSNSPDALLSAETARRGQDISSANSQARINAGSGRGGRNTGELTAAQQRTADDKLSNAKAIMDAYNPEGKPSTNKDGEDIFKPYTASEQIKFNEAANYIKAHDSEWNNQSQVIPEQTQGGNNEGAAWYDQTYRNAVAQGLTPEQATRYMNHIIGGQ